MEIIPDEMKGGMRKRNEGREIVVSQFLNQISPPRIMIVKFVNQKKKLTGRAIRDLFNLVIENYVKISETRDVIISKEASSLERTERSKNRESYMQAEDGEEERGFYYTPRRKRDRES